MNIDVAFWILFFLIGLGFMIIIPMLMAICKEVSKVRRCDLSSLDTDGIAARVSVGINHRLIQLLESFKRPSITDEQYYRAFRPHSDSEMKDILLAALKEYDKSKIPKEVTIAEVEKKFGHAVKVVT